MLNNKPRKQLTRTKTHKEFKILLTNSKMPSKPSWIKKLLSPEFTSSTTYSTWTSNASINREMRFFKTDSRLKLRRLVMNSKNSRDSLKLLKSQRKLGTMKMQDSERKDLIWIMLTGRVLQRRRLLLMKLSKTIKPPSKNLFKPMKQLCKPETTRSTSSNQQINSESNKSTMP